MSNTTIVQIKDEDKTSDILEKILHEKTEFVKFKPGLMCRTLIYYNIQFTLGKNAAKVTSILHDVYDDGLPGATLGEIIDKMDPLNEKKYSRIDDFFQSEIEKKFRKLAIKKREKTKDIFYLDI